MFEIALFHPELATSREWAAYHVFRRAHAEEDEPGEPVPADADFEHDARVRWPLYESRRIVARQGEEVVGVLGSWFRREGTPDYESYVPFMYAWGGVLRRWRRRGVATALLRALLAFMRERGKTTVTMGTHLPEGHAFLAAIGAVEKYRSIVNRIDFADLDWEELARWEAAANQPGRGLRWESYAGRVPLDQLAELCPQFTALFRDVPMGSLDLPPMRYELQGFIARYEEMDRRGDEHFVVLLMDGAEVAGMSEATWTTRFPDRVSQDLTAVAREWRGKGLGKGLKAAMLRLVRERHPEVRLMTTSNAEVNAAILAINQRLGAFVHRRDGSYQIGRDALADWLATRPPEPGQAEIVARCNDSEH